MDQREEINEKTSIEPDSIYGVSKYAGELFLHQLLKKTKIKHTSLEFLILMDLEKT